MRDRNGQHTIVTLQGLDAVHEGARRITRGVHQDDHFTIHHGQCRANALLDHGGAEIDQFEGALLDVGVRIFLVADQQVGLLQHGRAQMVVRIKFGADHHIGTYDLAHARQDVAFAVVIAVGDHGAVQPEQHHVHWQRLTQVVQ